MKSFADLIYKMDINYTAKEKLPLETLSCITFISSLKEIVE